MLHLDQLHEQLPAMLDAKHFTHLGHAVGNPLIASAKRCDHLRTG